MQNPVINGRYRILQKIGAGGFGMTYLAEDLRFPHRPKVVVKHLKPQINDENAQKIAHELFHQEAEILYRLGRYPNIPSLVAHFVENGEFFLVQEYIEGHTLDREFLGGKRYNQHEIIQLLGQILEILSFVHSEKVIHRDIKPANIIRSNSDGQLYLIDFGAVKQVNVLPSNSVSQNLSNNSVAIGSHGYMPLEQLAGNPNFSSDLYAFGLVVIEALTGIKPLELRKNNNNNEFIWANRVQLSPEVENFINKLVRYDSRQRYFSAKEALAVLNPIAARAGFFHNKPAVSVPLIIPPISSDTKFAVNNVPIHPEKPAQIPPTIIVSPQFEPRFNRAEEVTNSGAPHYLGENPIPENRTDDPRFLRNLSIALLSFALITVLFWLGTGGMKFITGKSETKKIEPPKQNSMIIEESMLDVYDEAVKQADEAKAKEAKAATKFDWNEIGNQYKRAYLLLTSLEQSHPKYKDAKKLIETYKKQSEIAYQKSNSAKGTLSLQKQASNNAR
jgi:serine/threonine protein kinase